MKWFEVNKVPFSFHDFRKEGLDKTLVKAWIRKLGYAALINKNSTTWRELMPEQQASIVDAKSALTLVMNHFTIIKRPVVALPDGEIIIGFKPDRYEAYKKNL